METFKIPAPGTEVPKAPEMPPQTTKPGLSGTMTEQDALNAANASRIDTLSSLTGAGGTGQPTGNPGGQNVSVGGMVDSKFAVNILDALLPALIVLACTKGGIKVKKTDFELTVKEKETIAPVLQQCLNSLMINFNNPWNALGVSLVVIYGSKTLEKVGTSWLENKTVKADKQNVEAAKQEPATEAVKEKEPVKVEPGIDYIPTEEQIKEVVFKNKCSREKAAEILKKRFKRGKLFSV